jgi:protein pelota
MKTLSFNAKDGVMKLIPTDPDDLWVIYNIVGKGDRVYGRSSRVIKVMNVGARPTDGKRVSLFLGIQVEKPIFKRMNDKLRIHGVIIDAPEKYAIKGSHHSITVYVGRPLTIVKDEWHRRELEMVERAGKWKTTPILITAIDDDECGIAVLRQNTLQILAEIRAKLPSKREADKRTAATASYFRDVLNILAMEWGREEGAVAIVGPGFLKGSFAKFLQEKRPDMAKRVSVVGLANSGGVGGVKEALRSGVLDRVTKRIRIVEESKAVEEVLRRLGVGKGTVAYGTNSVMKAVEYGAVDFLLVSDKVLREADDEERTHLEELMRKAEHMGGRVMIVGSEHEAGAKLLGLGGIAAQLRYAIDTT